MYFPAFNYFSNYITNRINCNNEELFFGKINFIKVNLVNEQHQYSE